MYCSKNFIYIGLFIPQITLKVRYKCRTFTWRFSGSMRFCSLFKFSQLTELRPQQRCLLLQSPHSPIFAILTYWVEMRWPPVAKCRYLFLIFTLALGLSRLSLQFFNSNSLNLRKMSQVLGDNSWFVMNSCILQRTSSLSFLPSLQDALCHPSALLLCLCLHPCTSPPTSTNTCLSLSLCFPISGSQTTSQPSFSNHKIVTISLSNLTAPTQPSLYILLSVA